MCIRRQVCNSGGKAHRNIFHPPHGAIRQPCGCRVCRSYARYLPSAGIFFGPAAPKNGGGTKQKYNFIQYLQKRFRTGHTVCPDGVCRKGTGDTAQAAPYPATGKRRKPGTAAYCRRLGEHPAARRECVTAQAGSPGTAWTRIPWRQAGIFPAYVRKSQPRSGNPPNFITFAGQARPVAAGRGRERKVRATQSTAQANDLISVRV